jgi:hypothetical protein
MSHSDGAIFCLARDYVGYFHVNKTKTPDVAPVDISVAPATTTEDKQEYKA